MRGIQSTARIREKAGVYKLLWVNMRGIRDYAEKWAFRGLFN
jgi:hypothetical protein